MESVFAIALLVLIPAGIVGVIWWFVLVSRFFSRLRKDHSAEYERLGSPTLFLNNSIRTNQLFGEYLNTRAYRSLNDMALTRLGDFMVPFLLLWKLGFLVAVGCVFGLWISARQ